MKFLAHKLAQISDDVLQKRMKNVSVNSVRREYARNVINTEPGRFHFCTLSDAKHVKAVLAYVFIALSKFKDISFKELNCQE